MPLFLPGTPPLEKMHFALAAYDDIRRTIREDEPPKPSQRSSKSDTLPSLAASRKTEPASLSRLLRGEPDWIVMKALEEDRALPCLDCRRQDLNLHGRLSPLGPEPSASA